MAANSLCRQERTRKSGGSKAESPFLCSNDHEEKEENESSPKRMKAQHLFSSLPSFARPTPLADHDDWQVLQLQRGEDNPISTRQVLYTSTSG